MTAKDIIEQFEKQQAEQLAELARTRDERVNQFVERHMRRWEQKRKQIDKGE